jgi:hypothetical protein
MHYKTLIDTNWLGQWDLVDPQTKKNREPVVVIASVNRYRPERPRKKKVGNVWQDEPNKRIDIGFVDKKKHWLAGPESQEIIAGLYGPDVSNWIGKKLQLFVDPNVAMKGKKVGGLRPRDRVPGQSPTNETLDNPVDEAKVEQLAEAFDEWGDDEPPHDDPSKSNPDEECSHGILLKDCKEKHTKTARAK